MRIGAVSYLNTKPLVYRLSELAPQHQLIFDLPSRLADQLAAGELDVALIPSVEYFQNPDYTIVSDACIACRGPVRSVKLFSRTPIENIRTLALDEGSRTSVALVQILLKERFGLTPQTLPFPISLRPDEVPADALLMIGDRAMHPPIGEFVAQWDLGDAWCRWSELPFVFAMWVARKGSGFAVQGSGKARDHEIKNRRQDNSQPLRELASVLSRARDLGVANVEEIAAREHAAAGIDRSDCLTYLRDHLHFHLGSREQAGLRLFRQHAARLDLAPCETTSASLPSRLAGKR